MFTVDFLVVLWSNTGLREKPKKLVNSYIYKAHLHFDTFWNWYLKISFYKVLSFYEFYVVTNSST